MPTAETILKNGGVVQCKQCFGDLVRLDGVLRCGTCGLLESEELPKDAGFRPKTPMEQLQEQVDHLQLANAEQAEWITEMEKELASREEEERSTAPGGAPDKPMFKVVGKDRRLVPVKSEAEA